ncbi:MAG: dynamin family protein [Bacilli bacterium]
MKNEQTAPSLQNEIVTLYSWLQLQNDDISARKVVELAKSWEEKRTYLMFCGHFSAGKSTLLNRLMGKAVLPTSPIPTSGNVVAIGPTFSEFALYTHYGEKIDVQEDLMENMQLYKSSDQVSLIERPVQEAWPYASFHFVDTPGVDSNDERHSQATERMLHLADSVVYTMDYNHVLAENNLQFMKSISERKIPLIVVINGCDKHDESELHFTTFVENVKHVLQNWNITSEALFTLSNVSPAFDSMFDDFVQFLHRQEEKLVQLQEFTLQQRLKMIFDESNVRLQTEKASVQQKILETEGMYSFLTEKYEQYRTYQDNSQLDEQVVFANIAKVVGNASIFRFEQRELAKNYLLSLEPNFKVGWFSSKQKVEIERRNRLAILVAEMQSYIQTIVDMQVYSEVLKTLRITSSAQPGVTPSKVNITPQFVQQNIPVGASVTGYAVLRFCDALVQRVTRLYKQAYSSVLGTFKSEVTHVLGNEKYAADMVETEKNYEELHQQRKRLSLLLQLEKGPTYTNDSYEDWMKERNASLEVNKVSFQALSRPEYSQQNEQSVVDTLPRTVYRTDEEVISQGSFVKERLEHYGLFEDARNQIAQLLASVEEKTYHVTLFGAFSAGKSSFLNAMLGENLLPVSPNPTTATIIEVKKPARGIASKMCVLHFKENKTLLHQLFEVAETYEIPLKGEAAVLDVCAQLLPQLEKSKRKTVHHFVQCVAQGYERFHSKLGEHVLCTHEEMVQWAQTEWMACLLERIELYFNHPYTQNGIVFVDTPGADSMNVRHTQLSFDYMKKADVLFYVTYYNHAFNATDRHVLTTLGNVSQFFLLDKMFFIINASDLASTSDELESVEHYVRNQLQTHGLNNVRLFSVSSKLALQLPESNAQCVQQFGAMKQQFEQFVSYSLQRLASEKLTTLTNSLQANTTQLLQQHAEGKEHILYRIAEMERRIPVLSQQFRQSVSDTEGIDVEWDAQMYYLFQRVGFSYSDLVKNSLHPGLLSSNDFSFNKALDIGMQNLLETLEAVLLREMLALGFRMENMYKNRLTASWTHVQREGENHDVPFYLPTKELPAWSDFIHKGRILSIHSEHFGRILAQWGSHKLYLQNKGQKTLEEESWQIIAERWKEVADDILKQMKYHYATLYNEGVILWGNELQYALQKQLTQVQQLVENEDTKVLLHSLQADLATVQKEGSMN